MQVINLLSTGTFNLNETKIKNQNKGIRSLNEQRDSPIQMLSAFVVKVYSLILGVLIDSLAPYVRRLLDFNKNDERNRAPFQINNTLSATLQTLQVFIQNCNWRSLNDLISDFFIYLFFF